ncbi:MAG: N-acetylmuramoyl-L-alanine amidase [Morganella sp. (in: enterobacteria)]
MPVVHAIVLHRTGSFSLSAAMASFRNSGIGTHFIIDKDGIIRQTANTNKYAYHIGKIRARYPLNTDSLGIEVVAKYNTATKL